VNKNFSLIKGCPLQTILAIPLPNEWNAFSERIRIADGFEGFREATIGERTLAQHWHIIKDRPDFVPNRHAETKCIEF
jgi:hypothetical protein